jgi:hypothetical protein
VGWILLGLGIEFAGTRAFYGSQELVLERFDSGAALVPLLAGLSWYHSLMLGISARPAAARAAAAALLALPVQIATVRHWTPIMPRSRRFR